MYGFILILEMNNLLCSHSVLYEYKVGVKKVQKLGQWKFALGILVEKNLSVKERALMAFSLD